MGNETKWADVAHYYAFSGIMGKLNWGPNSINLPLDNPQDAALIHDRLDHIRSGQIVFVPILRHLDDMLPDFYDRTPSDEEDATADRICATLWDIAFPDSKEDRSCGVFEQKQNGMWMLRYGSERLFLHECGEMFATDVNGPIPFNAAAMVHFLTSEGFDIFGLIKSGQAIRKEAGNG